MVGQFIMELIGRIHLKLKFGNRSRAQEFLRREYNGQYHKLGARFVSRGLKTGILIWLAVLFLGIIIVLVQGAVKG